MMKKDETCRVFTSRDVHELGRKLGGELHPAVPAPSPGVVKPARLDPVADGLRPAAAARGRHGNHVRKDAGVTFLSSPPSQSDSESAGQRGCTRGLTSPRLPRSREPDRPARYLTGRRRAARRGTARSAAESLVASVAPVRLLAALAAVESPLAASALVADHIARLVAVHVGAGPPAARRLLPALLGSRSSTASTLHLSHVHKSK